MAGVIVTDEPPAVAVRCCATGLAVVPQPASMRSTTTSQRHLREKGRGERLCTRDSCSFRASLDCCVTRPYAAVGGGLICVTLPIACTSCPLTYTCQTGHHPCMICSLKAASRRALVCCYCASV